jgi:hypothetical protein
MRTTRSTRLPPAGLHLGLLVLVALAAPLAMGQGSGVTVVTNPLLPVAGVPLEVTVSFDTPIQSASAFLRLTGSAAAYRELVGTDLGGGTSFRGTVPADLLGPQGFEGYVRYIRDGATLFEPVGGPQATPLRFPVLVPRIRGEIQLRPREYRMISVPLEFYSDFGSDFARGDFAEVFEGAFGAYNVEAWRLFRWDPALVEYRERERAVPRVRPGEGFWLVTANLSELVVRGAGTSGFRVVEDRFVQAPVTVTLQPGWNQIGNPFAFDLPWASVEGQAQVSAPVAFRGGYEPGQTTLRPWEGYFVENRAAGPVQLSFRVPSEQLASRDDRPFPARYLGDLGAGGYLLQAAVEGAAGRDLHTYVGLTHEGGDHDLGKAPPAIGVPRLVVEGEGRAWAGRILPAGAPPEWTLLLAEGSGPLALTLVEHGARPEGTLPVLRDAESGAVLAVGTGTVTLPPGARRLHLALVREDDAPSLPSDRWLEAVYPSPARPDLEAVSVRFWAPEGLPVELAVFDALGRRVALLLDAPGEGRWHTLAWDGRGVAGRALPSGTYLLRLRAGETTLSRRLTLVR